MCQISSGITFLTPIRHLVMSGRGLAKGEMSIVSLLICRMKHGVGESEHSRVQQAKSRLVQISQVVLIGRGFFIAIGVSIMLCRAEVWHCRRLIFEGVP